MVDLARIFQADWSKLDEEKRRDFAASVSGIVRLAMMSSPDCSDKANKAYKALKKAGLIGTRASSKNIVMVLGLLQNVLVAEIPGTEEGTLVAGAEAARDSHKSAVLGEDPSSDRGRLTVVKWRRMRNELDKLGGSISTAQRDALLNKYYAASEPLGEILCQAHARAPCLPPPLPCSDLHPRAFVTGVRCRLVPRAARRARDVARDIHLDAHRAPRWPRQS